jgi:ribose-phosphate pyrophosphokinase
VLSANAVERINMSPLSKLVVTDTVYIPPEKKIPKMVVISVAELFAQAITCSHTGKSISGLFGPV